jgi:hypothetical protein
LRRGLTIPGLAWNCDPPDLSLPSCWDYRLERAVPGINWIFLSIHFISFNYLFYYFSYLFGVYTIYILLTCTD